VTANHLLAYAALFEGKHVTSLDQTGLAQKGGAVLSSLTIASAPSLLSNRVGAGKADLVIGLDALGLANGANGACMSPERTVVVAEASPQPTAEAIRHVDFPSVPPVDVRRVVDGFSRAQDNVWLEDARAGELLGEHVVANVFMLGVACQAGRLPVSPESIEAAITLNGVAVEANLQAFRYGRLYHADPSRLAAPGGSAARSFDDERDRQLARLDGDGPDFLALLGRCDPLSEPTRRLLALRVAELIRYQNVPYARRYVDDVLATYERETQVVPGAEELTQAVSRYLYKLLAYKDEYEVARLLLTGDSAARAADTFRGATIKFNLHPPVLRGLGLKRKLELGAWFRPFLALLMRGRRVRGTRLDPFGRTEVRRLERSLPQWYRDVVAELLAGLDRDNHALAVAIASAPDRIRGYEQIKVASASATQELVAARLAEFRGQSAPLA
jgi:indolepyruvate ferredoxin oxidoreductase